MTSSDEIREKVRQLLMEAHELSPYLTVGALHVVVRTILSSLGLI